MSGREHERQRRQEALGQHRSWSVVKTRGVSGEACSSARNHQYRSLLPVDAVSKVWHIDAGADGATMRTAILTTTQTCVGAADGWWGAINGWKAPGLLLLLQQLDRGVEKRERERGRERNRVVDRVEEQRYDQLCAPCCSLIPSPYITLPPPSSSRSCTAHAPARTSMRSMLPA